MGWIGWASKIVRSTRAAGPQRWLARQRPAAAGDDVSRVTRLWTATDNPLRPEDPAAARPKLAPRMPSYGTSHPARLVTQSLPRFGLR
jgi:hypothetical protein